MFKVTVLYSLVLFIVVLNQTFARVAPSYINPCPGLKSDCLKKVIQEIIPQIAKGVPELGIDSLDPLKEDIVNLVLPGGFDIKFRNGSVTGFKKCTVDSASYKNNELDLKVRCDLIIKGKYKANGRILIVAINGDGDAKIKIKNDALHIKVKFADKVRDGVVYHEIEKMVITQNYGDKVTFVLTNLFKGNKELSEAVLLFLNQNWKQIADEFGEPLVQEIVRLVTIITKKFFQVIPKEELFVE